MKRHHGMKAERAARKNRMPCLSRRRRFPSRRLYAR